MAWIRKEDKYPAPFIDHFVMKEDGNICVARYLFGNEYEGWYIPDDRKIISQKEMKVVKYTSCLESDNWNDFIPMAELNKIFGCRRELTHEGYKINKWIVEMDM